jgi:hypothetical protein
VLELVETSLVALPPLALAAMAELTASGVRFAVDDFGTGYSSLARLTELPAQNVKVDRASSPRRRRPGGLRRGPRGGRHGPGDGPHTVAEGVETAEQFHVLRGIGVDAYQGWLFARPLPAPDLRALLAGDRLPTPAAAPDPVPRCRCGTAPSCQVDISLRCGTESRSDHNEVPFAAHGASLGHSATADQRSSVNQGVSRMIEFRGVTKQFPDGTVAVDQLDSSWTTAASPSSSVRPAAARPRRSA